MRIKKTSLRMLGILLPLATLMGCSSGQSNAQPEDAKDGAMAPSITPQEFSDAVHAVMMADRTVYATHVVTRLKKQSSVVKPSEYWTDEEGTIPLPAQMFRMGAELVSENPNAGFTYSLKSKWPLNEQNKATTPVEIKGLEYVAEHPDENFYGEEVLGGTTYFTSVYADKAVAQACWDCHNNHANRGADYPEFEKGNVMGGVIIRIPLGNNK